VKYLIKNNLSANLAKEMDKYQIDHKNNAPFVVVMVFYPLRRDHMNMKFYVTNAKERVDQP